MAETTQDTRDAALRMDAARFRRITRAFQDCVREILPHMDDAGENHYFIRQTKETQYLLDEMSTSLYGRRRAEFYQRTGIITAFAKDTPLSSKIQRGYHDEANRGIVIVAAPHMALSPEERFRALVVTLCHEIIHVEQAVAIGPKDFLGPQGSAINIGYFILREAGALAGEKILNYELNAAKAGRSAEPGSAFDAARNVFIDCTTQKDWINYATGNSLWPETLHRLQPTPLDFMRKEMGQGFIQKFTQAHGMSFL
ncbi:MAG: hypothetical protein WBK91_00180 [Alphaproteobacteria bacterium]